MYKVVIQTLDWDDYAIGSPTQIGPFDSIEAAEEFMRDSDKFVLTEPWPNYKRWVSTNTRMKHSVSIDSLTAGLTSPEQFKEWHER